MKQIDDLVPTIQAFRPFLPARDFDTSLRFYEALGFKSVPLGATIADLSLGRHAFLLQAFYVREWADNFVMHVLVDDVEEWWKHINALDLVKKFGVAAPRAPRAEPWGLTVAYVFDPAGVLWHFAQETKP